MRDNDSWMSAYLFFKIFQMVLILIQILIALAYRKWSENSDTKLVF